MNRIAVTLLSFILILICSASASACWCNQDILDTNAKVKKAILKEFHDSAVVFSGEVLEQNATGLKFKVHKVWKGNVSDEIIFTSRYHLPQGAGDGVEHFVWDCAYAFEVGKKYLVYAQTENGQLEVSKCSRTQPLNEGTLDIVVLDKFSVKRRKTASLTQWKRIERLELETANRQSAIGNRK